jgi:nicotinamide phosphoribosyltransferase
MLNQYGGEGKLLACVSDSYDIHNAVENLWGLKLKDEVYDMGGTLVVRPDSGDPVEMALYCVTKLGDTFGYTENSKGYKVLHPSVRVIQGDGCTPGTIYQILYGLKEAGWSAENIAFGMGGGLLQKVNRDTLRFAMKTSAVEIDGEWVPVSKSPVGMDWKASKAGILAVLEDGDTHRTVTGLSKEDQKYNLLKLVWKCGTMYRDYSFDEVRENAKVS